MAETTWVDTLKSIIGLLTREQFLVLAGVLYDALSIKKSP